MHATPEQSQAGDLYAAALHKLLPFHFFYEKEGLDLPDFTFLERDEVPYPYRSLLVHENDMTPTLAAFHHSRLSLEVHQSEAHSEFVMRLVSLVSAASGKPVEYGAIAIQLGNLPGPIREKVIEGHQPLGGILGEQQFDHRGSPQAYFSVPADSLIGGALHQEEGEILFGRCNQLLDKEGMVFADIVEILPRSDESERWVQNVTQS